MALDMRRIFKQEISTSGTRNFKLVTQRYTPSVHPTIRMYHYILPARLGFLGYYSNVTELFRRKLFFFPREHLVALLISFSSSMIQFSI